MLYAGIAQSAAARGQIVEVAMVDRLAAGFADDVPKEFWSSERLAELDETHGGQSLTRAQVDAHFAGKWEAWLQNRA